MDCLFLRHTEQTSCSVMSCMSVKGFKFELPLQWITLRYHTAFRLYTLYHLDLGVKDLELQLLISWIQILKGHGRKFTVFTVRRGYFKQRALFTWGGEWSSVWVGIIFYCLSASKLSAQMDFIRSVVCVYRPLKSDNQYNQFDKKTEQEVHSNNLPIHTLKKILYLHWWWLLKCSSQKDFFFLSITVHWKVLWVGKNCISVKICFWNLSF